MFRKKCPFVPDCYKAQWPVIKVRLGYRYKFKSIPTITFHLFSLFDPNLYQTRITRHRDQEGLKQRDIIVGHPYYPVVDSHVTH